MFVPARELPTLFGDLRLLLLLSILRDDIGIHCCDVRHRFLQTRVDKSELNRALDNLSVGVCLSVTVQVMVLHQVYKIEFYDLLISEICNRALRAQLKLQEFGNQNCEFFDFQKLIHS